MRNGGIQLRVSDLVFAVKKRWKLILLLTIVGLILGILMSGVSYLQGTMSKNFEVRGSVVTTSMSADGTYVNGSAHMAMDDLRYALEMTDEAAYILKSDRVLGEAIDNMGLIGVTVSDISGNLTVSRYNDTQIIELKLTWRTAEEGVQVMEAVIRAANNVIRDTMKAGWLEIVNIPSTRYLMGGGLNAPMWGYMLVLGFAAGVGIAVLELLMRPTLVNLRDVESVFNLETLGIIPKNDRYFRKKKSLLVTESALPSDVEQNYSATAYILRNRLDTKVKNHCFYITSATAGEGKTTVAANLAIQLSDMEKHVLLIDFNSQNPSLGSMFLNKVDYSHSLNALYKGETEEADAITTLPGYLDILPMVLENQAIPMDNAVVDLVNRLNEEYDYVIIDAPAVGEVSDTLSLNQIASTVLFVIRYDTPTLQSIRDALEKLSKSGIHVLGCVVNAAQSLSDVTDDSSGDSGLFRKSSRRQSGREGGFSGGTSDTEEELAKLINPGPESRKKKAGESKKPGKEKKEKQEKPSRRRRGGKKDVPEETPEKTGAEPSETEKKEPSPVKDPPVPRNLLEELDMMDAAPSTDEDAINALLKMGMEGDWEDDHNG